MVFETNAVIPTLLTIYTTPTCPDSHALKAWLHREGILYDERNLTEQAVTQEALDRYGVRVAPITAGEGWFTFGSFAKQKPEIEAVLQARARVITQNEATPSPSSKVWIQQANRTIQVLATQTVLDAALEQGIDYPHGCRSGRCGTCKSRLIDGKVDFLEHSRFALMDAEKAQGLILACCAIPTTDVVVAWLGADEEFPSHPHRRLNCRVTAIKDATHDIKDIRLANDGVEPLAFTAGQYARLTFPGAPSRDYSMACQPGGRELEFHIRQVPGGAATQRIHEQLKVGDSVMVEGPFGSSYLREQHTGPILCVAGGSGLAPIKGIIESAIARGMKQPIHVYFGVRSVCDLYLVDHFESLAERHPNLAFTPVLSYASLDADAPWRTGLVTDVIAKDLENFDGWKVYVAGPPPMVEAAIKIVTERGLQSSNLHADVFFTPGETSARRYVPGSSCAS